MLLMGILAASSEALPSALSIDDGGDLEAELFRCVDPGSRCVHVDKCLQESPEEDYEDLSNPQQVHNPRLAAFENCPEEDEVCCNSGNILPFEKV